jgi:cation diffusion facilitator CzcD-associated flavoprotein CzcO
VHGKVLMVTGCACDVPSHVYQFPFAPNPAWSKL